MTIEAQLAPLANFLPLDKLAAMISFPCEVLSEPVTSVIPCIIVANEAAPQTDE